MTFRAAALPQTTHKAKMGGGQTNTKGFAFVLVVTALLFEFGRPQELIPGLRAIPMPTLLDTLIGMSVFFSQRPTFANMQTRLWFPLFAVMAVHVPIATNNFWALMIGKDMFLVFCFYLGVITYIDTLEKVFSLMSTWLGVHVVLAIVGVARGGVGIGGWLGDENDFCMEMNVAIPFAYFAFVSASSQRKRVVSLTLLCLFILTVMATLSRGGFIGLTAVGMYCWMRSSRKIAAIVLVGFVIMFMIALAPQEYWNEVQSITDDQTMTTGTGGERFFIWGIAWEMFLANPIFGVGQGNLPWTIAEYEAGRTFNTMSRAGRQAHSAYFTLLPELGLFGVCIFVGMLLYSHKDAKFIESIHKRFIANKADAKAVEPIGQALALSRALEGALVGYLVSSIFISTLWYPSFWVLIGFVVALRNATARAYEEKYGENPASVRRNPLTIPAQRLKLRSWQSGTAK